MKILALLFTLLLTTGMVAQGQINIDGAVLDNKNNPIDLALVALLNPTDSVHIKSEFSDEDGSFLISSVRSRNYLLNISILGYEDHYELLEIDSNASNLSLQPIKLKTAMTQLTEVTITAKTPFIERKIDRTIINPDALISNAGSNALEVLERAPGISIDNNGAIMLKGRSGVSVFINDKPSYLSGAELENYLRSLPSGSIKQIEIMTNPPAKYEAAGNSGVINIIIKKNTLTGLHGNFTVGLRKGKYTRSNNSLILNYNKNKVSLYTNIYGGKWASYQDLNINRYYKNTFGESLSSFSQNSINFREGKYLNPKIGLDYYLNDKTTLGISYKNSTNPSDKSTDNTATISDPNNMILQEVIADNDSYGSFKNLLYNAYIAHNLDTLGAKLSLDLDFVKYNSDSDQSFLNTLYDENNEPTFQELTNGQTPSQIKIYAAKTDFSKPLGKTSRLEAGLKTALTKTDNDAIYTLTVDNVTVPDYNLSNRFLYDEWINAAYINYSQSFDRFSVQTGLRAETTKLTGEQLGNAEKPDTSFTRTYSEFFPTFYLSWNIDSSANNILSLSYGRRIDRPYYQDLNPFISPLDRFTFYSGNPDLVPTFSNNLSLSYSHKSLFSTSLNYSKTIDGINETLEIRDQIYYSRPGNIATNHNLTLSFDCSVPINSWYDLNSYIELGHVEYKSALYTETLDSKGNYHYLSLTNNFTLGKAWNASLGGQYRSDLVYSQLLLKSYWIMNIGIKKKVFDGKGTIKFSIDDLFYSRRGDGIINNLQLTDADWNSKYDSRIVSASFSYRFGKSSNNKLKHTSTGSESEQNRVKG